MNFKSQIGQDQWVIKTLDGKKNGTFVDIGAGHPIDINNTYALEKHYGWSGVSVDIGPPTAWGFRDGVSTIDDYKSFWAKERNTPIHCGDALKTNYTELFEQNRMSKDIDYLTIDIHPPYDTYLVLKEIPFSEYSFRVITFETDHHRDSRTRELSRAILEPLGYEVVKSDIQEDWYVKKQT